MLDFSIFACVGHVVDLAFNYFQQEGAIDRLVLLAQVLSLRLGTELIDRIILSPKIVALGGHKRTPVRHSPTERLPRLRQVNHF